MPRQLRQEFGVERAEQALDLAPALGPPNRGVDDAKPQASRDLIEVLAGEVAPVIDVEYVRDAADGPGRVGLAPDRMAQGKAGVQHAWGAKEHAVSCDGARMIVHDRGQPGAGRLAALVKDQEVEQRVIGLPDRVGRPGAVAVDQLEAVPERGRTVLRQRHQSWVEGGDDRMDGAVGRHTPALSLGGSGDPAVDSGGGRPWPFQRQALDERNKVRGQLTGACRRRGGWPLPGWPDRPGGSAPASAPLSGSGRQLRRRRASEERRPPGGTEARQNGPPPAYVAARPGPRRT